MARKNEWQNTAAQLIAAIVGGGAAAAAGATGAAIPVGVLAALAAKIVDVLTGRESREETFAEDVKRIKDSHVLKDAASLRDIILKASGVLPEYADERERLVAALEDPDRAKENELLQEAVQRLFDVADEATDDPQELDRLLVRKQMTLSVAAGATALQIDAGGNVEVHLETAPAPQPPAPQPQQPSRIPGQTYWPEHRFRPGWPVVVDPFCGRGAEMKQLRHALSRGDNLIAVVGMPGQGKSSLLAHWYHTSRPQTLKKRPIFWARPYETGYTFTHFLADILPYLTDGQYDFTGRRRLDEQVDDLCQLLRHKRTLLILDGVERWLAQWRADPDAAGADVPAEGRAGASAELDLLLNSATSWDADGSIILMTTRALPSALDNARVARIGTGIARDEHLEALPDDAAVELLEKLRVQDEPDDIRHAANEYGNHPLALNILGRLLAKEYGGSLAGRPDITADDAESPLTHLLDKVATHHTEDRPILDLAACSPTEAKLDMLAALLDQPEPDIRHRLAVLHDWHLVTFTGEAVELHPLIRRYFLARLEPEESKRHYLAMARWFADQPIPDQPMTLEEVRPRLTAIELALAGQDVEYAHTLLLRRAGRHHPTFTAWLVAFGHMATDIELCDGIIAQLDRLVTAAGRDDLRNDLARIYSNRGLAYRAQGELPRAVSDYDKAAEIWERLVRQEGRLDLRDHLAMVYNNRGLAYRAQGELPRAVSDYDKAAEIRERLVHQEGRLDLRNRLATIYNNRGNAFRAQGELPRAISDYDRAAEILERLVHQEGRLDLRNHLATIYNNRGVALHDQGELPRAVSDYDKAAEIRERLVHQGGRLDLRNNLALTYSNRGATFRDQGELPRAVSDYDKAAEILERLVRQEGRLDLRSYLALIYNNRAVALHDQGELPPAVSDYDKAAQIWEALVHQEDRLDLRNSLALIYSNRALVQVEQGDLPDALADCNKAVAICRELVEIEKRGDLGADLARYLGSRGVALLRLARPADAWGDLVSAQSLLWEAIRDDRPDLSPLMLHVMEDLPEAGLACGRAGEAAEWVDRVMGLLQGEAEAGRVTELLRRRAEEFYDKVGPRAEALGRAGMDVRRFENVRGMLGVGGGEEEVSP